MEVKKQNKEIEKLNNQLVQLEKLLYSIKAPEGQLILRMIENSLAYHKNDLEKTSLQPLKGPFYEYEKTDLQKMKALRAKIEVLTDLIDKFDIPGLEEDIREARNTMERVVEGEPLEPAY